MKKYLKPLLLLSLSVFIPALVHAQFGYRPFDYSAFWTIDPYKYRFVEIGVINGITSPNCEIDYSVSNNNGGYREKTARGKADLKFNVGLTIGAGIHLARLGDKSALGLNINMQYTFTKVVINSDAFKIQDVIPFSEDRDYNMSSIPISLDYKTGAEAISDRYLKSSFAFGAGIAPRFVAYGLMGGQATTSVSPFLKMEAGYFVGLSFKIRMLYYVGKQTWDKGYLNQPVVSNGPMGSDGYFNLSSSGEFLVSLIVMPYSRAWTD
jgi:hypothetical protein